MSKNNYDPLPLTVECGYCGSVYDFNEHRACPNCAAVPDKAQINAIKKEARLAAKELLELQLAAAKNSATVPSAGKFMRLLIKLIPLWIIIIFTVIWIPDAVKSSVRKNVTENLQIIDEPVYSVHEIGETFVYDGIFKVTADEFFIADSEAVNALLPEDFKMLAVHISAESDGSGGTNDYYDIDPYIIDGEVCRAAVFASALKTLPDTFAQTPFYFYSSKYDVSKEGYLCFIVGEDTESVDLCFEETHTQGGVRQLDRIHKITVSTAEV